MTEEQNTDVQQRLATLKAARAGVVSALVMHVERSEKLVAERDAMDAEIEELEAQGKT